MRITTDVHGGELLYVFRKRAAPFGLLPSGMAYGRPEASMREGKALFYEVE